MSNLSFGEQTDHNNQTHAQAGLLLQKDDHCKHRYLLADIITISVACIKIIFKFWQLENHYFWSHSVLLNFFEVQPELKYKIQKTPTKGVLAEPCSTSSLASIFGLLAAAESCSCCSRHNLWLRFGLDKGKQCNPPPHI